MKIKIGILAVLMLLFSLGFAQDVSGELEKAERIAQIAHEMRGQLMMVRDGVQGLTLSDAQKAEVLALVADKSQEIADLVGVESGGVSVQAIDPQVFVLLQGLIDNQAKVFYKTPRVKNVAIVQGAIDLLK